MPTKNKNKTPVPVPVTLSDDQKNTILEHMTDKPCIACTDHHEAYNCKKLTGPLSMMSWIFGEFPNRRTCDAARTCIGRLQAEKNAGVPGAPTDKPVVKEEKDTLLRDTKTMNIAENVAPPPVQVSTQATTQDLIQPSDAAPITTTTSDPSRIYSDPEITHAPSATLSPSPNLLQVSSVEMGEPQCWRRKILKPTFKPLKVADAIFPLRKALTPATFQVLTNSFEVKFKPDTQFFVYQLVGVPTGKSKRKAKLIAKTAIQAWEFLRENEGSFATDNNGTIVAWKNLHDTLGEPDKLGNNSSDEYNGDDSSSRDEWTCADISDGATTVSLRFKFCGKMNIDKIQAYVNPSGGSNSLGPSFNFDPIVTALNTVISKSLTDDVIQLSSNKFFIKSGYIPLSTKNNDAKALCTIRGYFYTIKPGMGKVLLNINAATSAFHQPMRVDEFLRDNTFPSDLRENVLTGLRVYIEPERKYKNAKDKDHIDHLNSRQKRIKTIKGFGTAIGSDVASMRFKKMVKNPATDTWGEAAKYTKIVDHMRDVYDIAPNPNLKVVNVGDDVNPCYYPQEFLRILPYQIYKKLIPEKLTDGMLRAACQGPQQSRALIEAEGLKHMGIVQQNGLQEFAKFPQLLIEPRMLQVPAAVMDKPVVIYSQGSELKIPDQNARWNLRGRVNFLESPQRAKLLRYYMFVDPELRDRNTVNIYQTELHKQVRIYGVGSGAQCEAWERLPGNSLSGLTHERMVQGFTNTIKGLKQRKPGGTLVVLLLASRSIPVYSAFKDVTDRCLGMQSICMTEAANLDQRSVAPYIANVMMKVNLKTGGRNHTAAGRGGQGKIEDTLRDTLVLGADVTHPGPGSIIGCPSIAAIVGSTDGSGGKFLGSMRLQEGKTEMIQDVKPMVVERLQAWSKHRKSYPTNILYYRDGVSTGQYAQVKDVELAQIREAYMAVVKEPLATLTAITAVKRHHTRLYPVKDHAMRNENCRPGTMIDSGITSPYFSDFYLQSHHGLQGTAIPTHYFVLENEMGLSDTAMQALTHKLCYTYVRATLGVSYAPPAYYADRLCERGRCYLRQWFAPDRKSPHYLEYVAKKEEIEQKFKDRLKINVQKMCEPVVRKGTRKPRKIEKQTDLERESRDESEKAVDAHFFGQAQEYLEEQRTEGPGPWSKNLDDTMFWM